MWNFGSLIPTLSVFNHYGSYFRYAQVVAEPFHVSKACLEPSSVKKGGDGGGKPVTSVYLESDNDEFLICSLTSSNLNENLDLNFNRGEKIIIRTEVRLIKTCFCS